MSDMFSPKLNTKFYIISVLLCVFVPLMWWMVYSLAFGNGTIEGFSEVGKWIFIAALFIIILNWTFSAFSLLRQMISGSAFCMDQNGIHSTLSVFKVFSLIFAVPVRNIPYSAIERVEEENGLLTLVLKKSEIDVFPLFRIFVSKRYNLFYGFTKENSDRIKEELGRYIKL